MRHHALPSVMAFVAQVAGRRVRCYATANLVQDEADAMVPKFADSWRRADRALNRSGCSSNRAATPYAGLHELNHARSESSPSAVAVLGCGVERLPAETWQPSQVTQAKESAARSTTSTSASRSGLRRRPAATDCDRSVNESPTFLLGQRPPEHQTARETLQPTQRNHVEIQFVNEITFFHLDCLCRDVRLNVDFEPDPDRRRRPPVPELGGTPERLSTCWPCALFRKFVDTPGDIEITTDGVIVRLSTRAHNPLLKEAGLDAADAPGPVAGQSFGAPGLPVTAPGHIPTPARRGMPAARHHESSEYRLGKPIPPRKSALIPSFFGSGRIEDREKLPSLRSGR